MARKQQTETRELTVAQTAHLRTIDEQARAVDIARRNFFDYLWAEHGLSGNGWRISDDYTRLERTEPDSETEAHDGDD